jgi:phenylacetate-coenzyme A ligase PaaK-like adenylate-forming protein
MTPEREESRKTRFRERLARGTVRYVATTIPWYRARERARGRPYAQLRELPVIDKEVFAEAAEQFLHLDRFPDLVLVTGGTTRTPLALFHSAEEFARIFAYIYGLRPGARYPAHALESFVLHATNHASFAMTGPSGRPIVTLPFTRRRHAELIRRFLEDALVVDGRRLHAEALLIPARELKALTMLLVQAGVRSAPPTLRTLLPYADFLTAAWRDALSSFWQCDIRPVYGLTEFAFAAMVQCTACGAYHVPPHVYPEVLSLDRARHVTAGAGVLVLSTLYPFVRAHPRLRYWTDDVVRIGAWCKGAQEPGLALCGRRSLCALVPDGDDADCVFSPVDLLEALDGIAAVRREDVLADFAPGYARRASRATGSGLGAPIATLALRTANGWGRHITVRIETTVAAARSRARTHALVEEVLHAVHVRCPRLDEAGVTLEVQCSAPGSLATDPAYQPLA